MKKLRNLNHDMDITNGPMFMKIILFSLPLILSGVLQLFYNAADVIVVGQYAGSTALAAVGSTGSLTNLIISLFMGLSVGTSVAVSQYYGAADHSNVKRVVHTSMAISIIAGVLLSAIGIIFAKDLLILMDTPEDVLDQSTLYMRIYFAGMPASMIYNFGSAILRAIGDTKRPLIFLAISGLVNVILNLIFVIGFHMDVAGVALATIISQIISAVLVVLCLMQFNGSCRLILKEIKLDKEMVLEMIRIGLPAGLQSTIFSLSNVLIQSSVNSFGSDVMAGNSAATNLEGFIYVGMNAIYHTALTFTGQNVGAKKFKRVNRVFGICTLLVVSIGLGMGIVVRIFGQQLLGVYAPGNDIVIGYGMRRLAIITVTYFLCGLMDVFCGMLRGMGTSIIPMFVSIIGVCGFRITWILTVFQNHRDLETLYISYPISWSATALIHLLFYFIFKRKIELREQMNLEALTQST